MIVFFVCSIFIATDGFSQFSIRGTLLASDKEVLRYGLVVLKQKSKEIQRVYSDSLGKYSLTKIDSGRYDLVIKYFDTYSKQISVYLQRDTIINIDLSNDQKLLDEVVVHSRVRLAEQRGDRIVFEPAKNLVEDNNALDIVKYVPLIQYRESNEAFSIVGKPQTTILINNKKTALPREILVEMLRSIPAKNIRNIEVVLNPGSEYASSITGGIININVKRFAYEGWYGNLALQTVQSIYNTTILNGSINYSRNKVTIQFIPFINSSFNFYERQDNLVFNNGNTTAISDTYLRKYMVLGGGMNIDISLNKNSILSYNGWFSNVDGNATNRSNSFFSNVGMPYKIDSVENTNVRSSDNYKYNFGNINFHHSFSASGNSSLDLNFDYNLFHQRQTNINDFVIYNPPSSSGGIASAYNTSSPRDIDNLSFRADYASKWKQNVRMTSGVQLSNSNVDFVFNTFNVGAGQSVFNPSLSNDYSYTENYLAGFVSFDKPLGRKTSVSIGLRGEMTNYTIKDRVQKKSNDSSYANIFPSFSFSWRPDKNNQIGLSFSKKIIRPNWSILLPGRNYYNTNYFSENDPYLQPTIAYNLELSYLFKNVYTFNLSYNHSNNSFSNFTVPFIEAGTAKVKNTFLNYGQVNNFYLNVSYNKVIFKVWDLSITPSYKYSVSRSFNFFTPLHITNSAVSLNIYNSISISPKNKLSGTVTFQFDSKQRTINNEVLNNLSSLDISLKKVIGSFSLYLYLNDIYNGTSKVRNRLTAGGELNSNQSNYNYYNRAFSMKIRYVFGNKGINKSRNRGSANDEIKSRINP